MTAPDLDSLAALLDKNPHDGTDAAQALLALPALIARVRELELEREREPRRDLGGSTHWDIAEAGAVCHDECVVAQIKGAALAMRERCAQLLNITRSDAQLMAGDMTAGEWRTVSAVLRNRAAAIRALEV